MRGGVCRERFAGSGLWGKVCLVSFSGSGLLDEIRWAGIYWVQCSGRGKVLGFPGFVGWDLLDWLVRLGLLNTVSLFAGLGFTGLVGWV